MKFPIRPLGLLCCFATAAFASQKAQLVQTFEYDQPDHENFDSRPIVMSDGSILERIVSGPSGQMVRFSQSGQLLDGTPAPRSFHDNNSFVAMTDGTTAIFTSADKTITFWGSDKQQKAKVSLSGFVNSLSSGLIGLGDSVLFYNGQFARDLSIYSSLGVLEGHIHVPASDILRAFSITSDREIAVLGQSPGSLQFYDLKGNLLRTITLVGSGHPDAPIFLKDQSMISHCDMNSVCSNAADGSLRWKKDLPSLVRELAVLPDGGVVCQTISNGVSIFNADGSIRIQLYPGEQADGTGPIVVSPAGIIAIHHELPLGGGSSYSFMDSDGADIGRVNLLTFGSTPVAADGENFILADIYRLSEFKVIPVSE